MRYTSSLTLVSALLSAVNARPGNILPRQDPVIAWVTEQATVTTQQVVATAYQTVPGSPQQTTSPAPSPVVQTQVVVNQINVQYTYSSARTVFAVPTVVASTLTQTATVTPYVSNGVTVTPPNMATITNTIDAQATPTGSAAGSPLTGTLPLVSVLIGGATVTVSEQTFTYYTPVVNAVGQTATAQAATTAQANAGMSSVSDIISTKQSGSTTLPSNQGTSVVYGSSTIESGSSAATPATTGSPSATQTATTPSSISESSQDLFVQAVLSSMNTVRASHSAANLTWDYGLASAALTYAQSCNFNHSTDPSFGETLAAGTATDPTFYINLWAQEASLYNFSNPGFSDATGHFTQLVWAATTKVGCGFSSGCGQYSNYLVCRYTAAGNVVGGTNNNQYFIDNVKSS